MALWRHVSSGIVIGLLAASVAAADEVKIVSRLSLGRMPVEGTADFQLVANQDLTRVAVMDRWGDEHKWYVVQNSIVWEFYNEMDAPSAQFSPDGEHLSLLAKHDGKWFVIRDNADVRSLGTDRCRGLVLSADGKHDACVRKTAVGEEVLLDGKVVVMDAVMPRGMLDEVAGLAFGADGRLAISGRAGGKAYVALGGRVLGSVAADQVLPVAFSGEHVLCGASQRDGTGTQIMRLVDGAVEQTWPAPLAWTDVTALTQSADGEQVAWAEWDQAGYRVVVNGVRRDAMVKDVNRIVVSSDAKHVVWVCGSDAAGRVLVFDEKTWSVPNLGKDYRLTLSDDGKSVHCVGAGVRYDFSLLGGKWLPQVVANGGEGGVVVQVPTNVWVNDTVVDRGHFLEARVGDSQTAYTLTWSDVPVQVNEKRLGEMTRTEVHVGK